MYLQQRRAHFVEKDVSKDPAAKQELARLAQRKGFPAGVVPVIDVHGEVVVGFNRAKLDRLLRRAI